jgi:putative RNA 2'-phosphotransferase
MSLTHKSKYLALLLRHAPEKGGITLDEHGWAVVADLTDPAKAGFSLAELHEIVRTDAKGRYELNKEGTHIRAVQGHSLADIEVGFTETEPPATLWHGTKQQFMAAIRSEGLQKMTRQYVHLSATEKTAWEVAGRRSGQSVLCTIDAAAMYRDGYKFYEAKNGVWLTLAVPYTYMTTTEKR